MPWLPYQACWSFSLFKYRFYSDVDSTASFPLSPQARARQNAPWTCAHPFPVRPRDIANAFVVVVFIRTTQKPVLAKRRNAFQNAFYLFPSNLRFQVLYKKYTHGRARKCKNEKIGGRDSALQAGKTKKLGAHLKIRNERPSPEKLLSKSREKKVRFSVSRRWPGAGGGGGSGLDVTCRRWCERAEA